MARENGEHPSEHGSDRDSRPQSSDAVQRRLVTEGWRFDFMQAVWLLERLLLPDAPVGGRGPLDSERIRLRPDLSVGFPACDVRRIAPRKEPDEPLRYWIDVTFMGLYGVSSPLPAHYGIDILRGVEPRMASVPSDEVSAELALEEGSPVRDFLDLFHHRLISLFYRAATKYRYPLTFGLPRRDRITDFLLWLIGLSPDAEARVIGVSPIRLLRYAGTLTQHPRSSASLEGVLSDYWGGLPVEIEQFVGRWVAVDPADTNRVGDVHCGLGDDLIIGEEVFDRSGMFSVIVGPVEWSTYVRFLPDGEAFAQTHALVRLYCCDPLSFTIEVKLAARQVPPLFVSSDDEAGRLGYTSWVRTGDLAETSVVFTEAAVA